MERSAYEGCGGAGDSGMHHHLTEDVPHGAISIALLAMARDGETTCKHRPEHAAGDELRAENARLREQLLSQSQGSELQGSE